MYSQLQTSISDILTKLTDSFINFRGILRLIHIAKEVFTILFETHFFIAKEQLSCGLRLTKKIVDIDSNENPYLGDIFQFLAQFEVSAGTKIANHGMENVEVGHCRGDAVELVHQRRLNIIEELGTHDVSRLAFCFSETSQKKNP